MNHKVDTYLSSVGKWQNLLIKLRLIALECGLVEEFKWKHPCYTFHRNNIFLIHEFKDYCAILFFKGVLLSDKNKILTKQSDNVQTARQIRFTQLDEIEKQEPLIKAYIYEAIEVEKAGLKIPLKKPSDFKMPQELRLRFNDSPELKTAFEALTPGRQKGYLLYFSQAKQSKTRKSRIEKYEKRILLGKGLNDCVCGLTKRKPNCDGSHKFNKI